MEVSELGEFMTNAQMKLGPEYYRIIGRWEQGPGGGPALTAYRCPAGVATIGLGSIKRKDGTPVEMGDCITEHEVFELAERDAEDAADAVRKIKRPLNQHQFDALTSFTQNLGEGNLARLLPLIEAGRWEDAAEKMCEYVRAWGRYEGKWYYMALLGLRIRRAAEGLLLLSRDWADVCDADNIGMPRQKPPEWQPEGIARDGTRGRFFDVLLPGATEFTLLESMAAPLPASEPVLSQPAPPLVATTRVPEAMGAAVAPTQPVQPPSSAPKVSPAPSVVPPAPAEKQASVIPAPTAKPAPVPLPPAGQVGGVIVRKGEVSTKPPEPLPPPLPPPRDPLPADLVNPKDMLLSRRFWGLAVTAVGTTHLIPADWSRWMANETTRELVSWIAVVLVGVIIYWVGKKRAKRPLK